MNRHSPDSLLAGFSPGATNCHLSRSEYPLGGECFRQMHNGTGLTAVIA